MVDFTVDFVNNTEVSGRYMKKKYLTNLEPNDYEHHGDKDTINILKNKSGVEKIKKTFIELGIERKQIIQLTGSNIKVTKNNLPYVYETFLEACKILDIKNIPGLYIKQGLLDTFTEGIENPIVVLQSGCLSLLTHDELLFVLGHELGHIKSNHLLYHTMRNSLPYLSQKIEQSTLGMGGIISMGIEIALSNWNRQSEYTADRAGLLTCQNVDAGISALMKMAGFPPKYYDTLNIEDFIKQAKEFDKLDEDSYNKIVKYLSTMDSSQPMIVKRTSELVKWIESGDYKKVLDYRTNNESSYDIEQEEALSTIRNVIETKVNIKNDDKRNSMDEVFDDFTENDITLQNGLKEVIIEFENNNLISNNSIVSFGKYLNKEKTIDLRNNIQTYIIKSKSEIKLDNILGYYHDTVTENGDGTILVTKEGIITKKNTSYEFIHFKDFSRKAGYILSFLTTKMYIRTENKSYYFELSNDDITIIFIDFINTIYNYYQSNL